MESIIYFRSKQNNTTTVTDYSKKYLQCVVKESLAILTLKSQTDIQTDVQWKSYVIEL